MYGNFEILRDAASRFRFWPAYATTLLSAFLLSGCATFSPDGGMTAVADFASETIKKDVVSIRTADDAERAQNVVRGFRRRGLTADTAVQIALLNNRGLQASYNELALAEANLVQDSLPPNATFSISRISGDGAMEIERQESSATSWRWRPCRSDRR
jgi:hypothetical protein